MSEPNALSVVEVAQRIQDGTLSCEALMRACIQRVEARNHDVKAVVSFDPDRALAAAQRQDASQQASPQLRGIPFLAKDVIDSATLPTSYGSPIYRNHRSSLDAACIWALQQQGAILLGKAATSEFATRHPAPTRNPLRLTHTPGGSSSGSAAAVADYMVPFALGTQSTGSICRPASYCGIVGYKPSFDLFSRAGLKMTSQSQETIGLLTRSARDAAFIVFNDLVDEPAGDSLVWPRMAVCRSSQWAFVAPAFSTALDTLLERLGRSSQVVEHLTLDANFETLVETQAAIFSYELAQALGNEYTRHPEALSDQLRARIVQGARISIQSYLQLRSSVEQAKSTLDRLFQGADILLYPASDSSAEDGLAYSGSPRFGALWTLLHLPTVTIPLGRTDNGMPFGVQLIGRFGTDRRVLATAHALESLTDMTLQAPI
ncbi:amidase [Castellaniella sp.]|uniref:amidase n=1 Tax=Castellaniella sp. TaxID=1955812 RepID=UPI002AFE8FBF|nr:amidase [Castellaniella sp.]